MRAVLQRVTSAKVEVDRKIVGAIGPGWLVLLGVGKGDDGKDVELIADKIMNIRAFSDADGKMNLSLAEVSGEVLLVSQFTLWGDCRKGRRPGFSDAAPPDIANQLYQDVKAKLLAHDIKVATGTFQAHMAVSLVNDGPVTLLVDSKKNF
jgi:D-tyrosyl-tRNA(Tyr) deacylase